MRRTWWKFLAAAPLLCCAWAQLSAAPTEYFWNNAAGGDYATSGNWSPAGPPTGADDANFNLGSAGYTVSFSAANSARRFVVANDTVTANLGGNTYTAVDSSNTLSETTIVGNSSGDVGSLTVQNGTFTSYGTILGAAAGSQGTLTVDGSAGAVLFDDLGGGLSTSFYVGQNGTGTLNVINGGQVTASDDMRVGENSVTSSGTVNVNGTSSTLSVSDLFSGNGGTAAINVTNGGTISLGDEMIAGAGTSMLIDGTGSNLNGGLLDVGDGTGTASITVQNGGSLAPISLYVGDSGSGSVTVTGTGTVFHSSSIVDIGVNTTGQLTIEGGASATLASTTVGDNASGNGTLTIDGTGTTVTFNTALSIGEKGTGLVQIQNGAQVSQMGGDGLSIGALSTGHGTLNVDGAGSAFSSITVIDVGGGSTGGGSGFLNVTHGGSVTASNINIGATGPGQVVVDGTGSALGTLGSTGSVNVGEQNTGSLTFQNGGSFGTASTTSRRLIVGDAAAGNGTVTVTGASTQINTDALTVGNGGTGVLNIQNGGQVVHGTADLNVAAVSGSHGAINVDGAGSQLSAAGNAYIGGTSSGAGGTGQLTVTNGGSVAVTGTLTNWSSGTVDNQSGTVSATVAVQNYGLFHNDSAVVANFVNNSGGTLSGGGTINGSLTLNSGSVLSPGNSPGTLNVVGATTWNGGATYKFEVNSALGTAGASPGWDLLNITGALNLSGSATNQLVISINSLLPGGGEGALSDFDPSVVHNWIFATASGGITGFSSSEFLIDTSHFDNSLGSYQFSVVQVGNSLELTEVTAPVEYSWNAPTSGAFNDSTHWTPTGVPSANDGANFNTGSSGVSVNFANDVTNGHLTVANDNVTLALGGHTYSLVDTNSGSTNTILVGQNAGDVGSLTVQNGTLTGNNLSLAYSAGSQGTLTVDGSAGAANLQVGGSGSVIGLYGTGALNVQNGGQATNSGNFALAPNVGSAGSVSVDGAGSQLSTSGGDVFVGGNGTGSISVTNGGTFNGPTSAANGVYFGQVNGQGQISVDGSGSSFSTAATVYVGSNLSSNTGTGSVTVTNGGSFTGGNVSLAGNSGGTSSITVDGTGSFFSGSQVSIGGTGASNLTVQNGGQLNADSFSMLGSGTGTSGAAATFDGSGSSLNVTGTSDVLIGTSSGTTTLTFQNGANLSMAAASTTRRLAVGAGTGSATMNVTGSSTALLTTSALQVGYTGTGTLNVTGGASLTNSGDLSVAVQSGSHGSVTVDGTGSLLAVSNAYIGGSISGAGGAGSLTVSHGGSFTSTLLTVFGTGSVNVDASSSITAAVQSGGSFHLDGLLTGSFNNTSGGLLSGSGTITGPLTLASGSTISPGDSPGILNVGATTWGGGATYKFEINAATGNAGTSPGWDLLNINGGLNLTGSPSNRMIIDVNSLLSDGMHGPLADFNPTSPYTWIFATASGGITNFASNDFTVLTGNFVNSLGAYHFVVTEIGNSLALTLSNAPVPEPGSLGLLALGGGALWFYVRRGRKNRRS